MSPVVYDGDSGDIERLHPIGAPLALNPDHVDVLLGDYIARLLGPGQLKAIQTMHEEKEE